MAKLLLDLGEFDEGGLENNLEIKFKTWFPLAQALRLHKYRVIRVDNAELQSFYERTALTAFQYFRIKKLRRLPNLQVEVTAQAYARTHAAATETGFVVPAGQIKPNIGPITITGGIPRRAAREPVIEIRRKNDHVAVKVGE
jgi:hypothetical protein